jgi:hypothetical protein
MNLLRKAGSVLSLERRVHKTTASLEMCIYDSTETARTIDGASVTVIPGPVQYEFFNRGTGQISLVTADKHAVVVTPEGHIVDVARRPGDRAFKDMEEYKARGLNKNSRR